MDLIDKLLISEVNSVETGSWFPGCNPYSAKEDLARLQSGVDKGLYSQAYLNSVLNEMRKSDSFKKLSAIHERMFRLDHTPFVNGENTDMKDYGFHLFVGRAVFDDGSENYATLTAIGSDNYLGLGQAIGDIVSAIEKNRKVLLTKSPGRWDGSKSSLVSRTYMPFDEDDMVYVKKGVGDKIVENKLIVNPFDYQP